MAELTLSVFERNSEVIGRIRALLDQFEKRERLQVHLEVIPFRGGWREMVDVALHHFGPDVSEVGSTWINDFVRMNALEPFTAQEIRQLGGANSFQPINWHSCHTPGHEGNQLVWAIPWSSDVRVILYRQDFLEKAGLNENTAFRTSQQLENTLQKLSQTDVDVPFALPTLRSRISIHNLASFVWEAGGDFIGADGRELLITHPKTREGMKNYFRLGRFIPKAYHEVVEYVPDQLFYGGQTAIIFTGYWALQVLEILPEIKKHTRVTQLPGPTYVGGLNLLVWKHTRKRKEAIQLIQYLTNTEINHTLFPDLGLPARLTGLQYPPFSTDANFQKMVNIIEQGRRLSAQHLWGMVESRLTDIVPVIWQDVFANPDGDLDTLLDKYIPPLARRLEGALSVLK